MRSSYAHIALSAVALSACSNADHPTEANDIPIACRLDTMTAEDRAREGALLREHLTAFVEVRERDDGYSYRYAADATVFVHMAELVALEHRCCPFLSFDLQWQGADEPPWLHVVGGARAKPFIASTFGATAARAEE